MARDWALTPGRQCTDTNLYGTAFTKRFVDTRAKIRRCVNALTGEVIYSYVGAASDVEAAVGLGFERTHYRRAITRKPAIAKKLLAHAIDDDTQAEIVLDALSHARTT